MTLVKNPATATAKTASSKSDELSKKEEPKAAVIKMSPEAATNDSPLEDRLLKLNRLFEVQAKYNRLEQSLTTLKDFDLKKEGENISLELYDETTRKRFSTKNPDVVHEITAALRQIIQRKKKALEPLLTW